MRIATSFILIMVIVVEATSQSSYVDSLRTNLRLEKNPAQRIEMLSELARELMRITPDEALYQAQELKRISDSIKSVRGLAHYYRVMSGINAMQGNYLSSTSQIFEAIKLYEQLHDSTGLANSYITHANNYSRQKLYSQAAVYYKRALKIFEKQHNQKRIGVS